MFDVDLMVDTLVVSSISFEAFLLTSLNKYNLGEVNLERGELLQAKLQSFIPAAEVSNLNSILFSLARVLLFRNKDIVTEKGMPFWRYIT
jgi:hypothetical protein